MDDPMGDSEHAEADAVSRAGCQTSERGGGDMIVVTIEGGLIRGVSSDEPELVGKDVVVIDYDAEGAEAEEIHRIPQGGGDTEEALIDRREVGVLYGPVAEYLRRTA